MLTTGLLHHSGWGYLPHQVCLLYNSLLVYGNVISDAVVAGSYFAIASLIIWFLHRRPDLPTRYLVKLTAWVFLFCGLTHVVKIQQMFWGEYYLGLVVNIVMAVVSFTAAVISGFVMISHADWILSSQLDFSTRLSVKDAEIKELKSAITNGGHDGK